MNEKQKKKSLFSFPQILDGSLMTLFFPYVTSLKITIAPNIKLRPLDFHSASPPHPQKSLIVIQIATLSIVLQAYSFKIFSARTPSPSQGTSQNEQQT